MNQLKKKYHFETGKTYLDHVAIKRVRFERLMASGDIRVKDKEDYDIKNSSIRVYAEDIYKQLIL